MKVRIAIEEETDEWGPRPRTEAPRIEACWYCRSASVSQARSSDNGSRTQLQKRNLSVSDLEWECAEDGATHPLRYSSILMSL